MSMMGPRGSRLWVVVVLAMVVAVPLIYTFFPHSVAPQPPWSRTEWNGERAWEATCEGWTAVVSEERARLIFLGKKGGENLLYAPRERQGWWWGGHLCWLGPQSLWKWPPPPDWDNSAAARVEVHNGVLRVTHPHADGRFPAMERGYSWEGARLKCGQFWRSATQEGFAMQIVEVPEEAVVEIPLQPSAALPHGFAIVTNGHQTEFALPFLGLKEGTRVFEVGHQEEAVKLAFPPGPIVARRKGLRLTMTAGSHSGHVVGQPEAGLTTLLWPGNQENRFLELEQFSPVVRPIDGVASFTVYLEPGEDDGRPCLQRPEGP